jgi:hypothetical protein
MDKKNQKTNKKSDITLNIIKKYDNFNEYYNDNKFLIYSQVLDMFKLLSSTKKRKVKLLVTGLIGEINFETLYIYNKNKKDILKNTLLPYFKKNEEYEKCDEIIKIYDNL